MADKVLMKGNEAIAEAAIMAGCRHYFGYPITPQTIIVEKFSDYVADGDVQTEFVCVESEHSALTVCTGSGSAGARTFTATSSQGLAYMWEMLPITSAMRVPLVMAVANRAISGPININNDHSDSMGARDAGWIQIYAENAQEAYDNYIQCVRIGEHKDVQLPVMACQDGFITSHAVENFLLLEDAEVKAFAEEDLVNAIRIEDKLERYAAIDEGFCRFRQDIQSGKTIHIPSAEEQRQVCLQAYSRCDLYQ